MSRVLHDILAEVMDQAGDGRWLAVLVMSGDVELMLSLVGKEHLQPAPVAHDGVVSVPLSLL